MIPADALRLWIAFSLPAIAAAPLLRRAFPGLRDGGASVARPAAWLLIAWLAWFTASLPGLAVYGTPLVAGATVLLAALGGWIAWQDRAAWRDLLKREWRTIVLGEAIGIVVFAVGVSLVRWNGDIHPLAERFMDYAIIRRIELSTSFPPQDSWLSGLTLQYYYYGYLVMDVLRRLADMTLRDFFNPAIAGVYATFAIALYGAGMAVGRSRGAGVIAAIAGAAVGNYDLARQILGSRKLLGLDWFHTSRVIDGTINETPIFAAFWGDLHPYLIAFPFVVLCITLIVASLSAESHPLAGDRPVADRVIALALLVIPLGALFPTNSWDFPTFLGLALAALAWPLVDFAGIAAAWDRFRGKGWTDAQPDAVRVARSLAKPAAVCAVVAVLSVLAYVFFHVGFGGQVSRGVRLAQRRSDVVPMLVHFGPWFFAVVLWAAATSKGWSMRLRRLLPLPAVAFLLVAFEWWALPYVEGVVKALAGGSAAWLAQGIDQLLLRGLAFGVVIAALWVLLADLEGKDIRTPEGMSRLLAVAAFFVVLVCEFAYVDDFYGGKNERMNTVFKAYIQAWILLGIASAGLLAAGWHALAESVPGLNAKRAALGICAALVLVPGLAFPAFADYNRSGGWRTTRSGNQPTLDPLDLFRDRLPADYHAIEWVERTLPPDAVVLEASAHAYEWESRIATFSGRPTFVGWKNHESGWRNDWTIPTERGKIVDAIYESTDLEAAWALCRANGIDYVFVGELERERAVLPEGLAAEEIRRRLGMPRRVQEGRGSIFGKPVGGWERWSYGGMSVWIADGALVRTDQKRDTATYHIETFLQAPAAYSSDRVSIFKVPPSAPSEPVTSKN